MGRGRHSPIQGRDGHALPGPSPLPSLTLVPLADYQTLRIGGLVFAVVLFSVGILLILSKFVCPFVHSKGSVCSCEVSGEQCKRLAVLFPGEGRSLSVFLVISRA